VPQPPSITNLDVTSLCALVSEVSWGDPHSPQLQAWAARTVHWRVSIWQVAVWRGASIWSDGRTLEACLIIIIKSPIKRAHSVVCQHVSG
jgi:hypothetical protein